MESKVRSRRKELKMSQSELAEKSGVSRLTVILLENNPAKNTSSKTLIAIAKALNDTVENLFFSNGVN